MGTTYSNCQVRSDAQGTVIEILQGWLKEPAYVSPAVNGWVGIYPEEGATDPTLLAEELSRRLAGTVLTLMVHDSDVFVYELYESGTLCDEFNSDPEWTNDEDFPPPTDADKTRMWGDPEALLPYCVPGVEVAQVREVLHPTQTAEVGRFDPPVQLPPGLGKAMVQWAHLLETTPEALRQGIEQKGREKYLFAEEQAADLVALLGMDEELAQGRYRDIEQGDLEDCIAADFCWVSPEKLSQEYKNNKLWGGDLIQRPEKLREWLQQGADPNWRDADGKPILLRWAQSCLPEQVSLLLEAGADINAGTTPSPHLSWGHGYEGGVTALMAASGSTYEQPGRVMDTVQVLLNAGADVNAWSETGRTALSEALQMLDPARHQGRIGRVAPEDVLRQAAARSAQVVKILREAGAVE